MKTRKTEEEKTMLDQCQSLRYNNFIINKWVRFGIVLIFLISGELRIALGQSLWCQNHMCLRFLLLNNLNRTALKLRLSPILFFLRSSSIFHFIKSRLVVWAK
jgi:hypothetical protein